ncbi:hypothetical protein [Streptomyces roseus]|uniref:hypothetical protein n=1 Tax=Streptomyces roseus TaxID=66430 RepID=UPI0007C72A7A|nr:hypothetical protein [Streptomyces roseus]
MSTPEEQQQQHRQQQRQEPDPYGTQTWQSDTWETGYQPVQQQQHHQQPQGWPPPEAAAPGQSAYPSPPHQHHQQQPVAPEGWFRDEAPAAPGPPASGVREELPAAGWAPSAGAWSEGSAAEQTAYLPPQGAAPAGGAAEQTAYLPPYPGAAAAAETAYLPPYPGPGAAGPEGAAGSPYPAGAEPQAQAAAPDGWFRDGAPVAQAHAEAPASAADWRGAPADPGSAAEQTAYLPPQAEAAEQTAYLPPYPGPAAAEAPYPGPGAGETAPGADGEEPAYSPPTLGGNTVRAVDPAQARAEGRSPIIDPGPQPAILTAALGLLLAGAAAVGELALLGPLIVLQALTAAGWFRLNGMWPARQGIALAFLGALVADAAVLAVDDTYGPGAIIGTLGAWVLLTLVLQLRSHADPDERMYGLMASVASAALAIVCAGYLAADSAAVSVGAAAVAVAVFTRALPLPTPVSVGVSLAAATGAGIAVGGLTSVGVGGALLGLAAGVCALVGLRVAAYDYPSKFVHMTAGVALPLAAAAPAVYLIGRVVG